MIRHLFIAVAFLAAPPIALADDAETQDAPAGTPVLSLHDVVALALDQNIELERAESQVELGAITVDTRLRDFLPSLSLSVSPSFSTGQSFDSVTGQLGTDHSVSANAGLSASMTLFDGFANVASLEEARRALEGVEQTFAWVAQNTVHQVTNQYLQLFLTEELVRVEENNLEAQRRQLERIEAHHAAGNLSQADVLQQRAAIAQSEQRLIGAQRNAAQTHLRLLQTLRLDPRAEVTFAPPTEAQLLAFTASPVATGDALVAQAQQSRADLGAQRAYIEAARQGIRVAGATAFPTVSLSASVGTSYSSRSDAFGFLDQFSSVNPSGGFGLSISLPIFDRGRTAANRDRAEIAHRNEQLALEALEQDVLFSVEEVLLDVRMAEAQMAAAAAQREAAAQALEVTEARYEVGASTLFEVIQSRQLLVEAEARQAEANHALLASRLALSHVTGSVTELISKL